MKNKKTFALFVMLIVFLPLFVSAQYGGGASGMLGGTEKGILQTAVNIINFPVPISGATWWGYEPKLDDKGKVSGSITMSSGTPSVPLWLLAAVFTVIFTILWVASGFVPLFKNDENKGPRKFFVIAITLLTMFTTPVVLMLITMISTFTSLAYLAFLILGIYTLWVLFRSGWAGNAKENAASTRSLADAQQMSAEARRQMAQTDEFKDKTKKAAKTGVNQQGKAIRNLRKDLTRVLNDFTSIRKGRVTSNLGRNLEKRVMKDLSDISTDLGKILTFKTENDRIMSQMNSTNFATANRSTIPLNTTRAASQGQAQAIMVEKQVASETNDLGRIISGVMQEVRTNSITDANIGRLIEMTSNAVNIATRMERDIVLEEQMIEKI